RERGSENRSDHEAFRSSHRKTSSLRLPSLLLGDSRRRPFSPGEHRARHRARPARADPRPVVGAESLSAGSSLSKRTLDALAASFSLLTSGSASLDPIFSGGDQIPIFLGGGYEIPNGDSRAGSLDGGSPGWRKPSRAGRHDDHVTDRSADHPDAAARRRVPT